VLGRNYVFDPPDAAIAQPHFNAMRVTGGSGQNRLDPAAGQATAALVFFKHDLDFQTGVDVFTDASVQCDQPSRNNSCVDVLISDIA
jgi:hypothetical protein